MESKLAGSILFVRIYSGENIFKALSDACTKHNVKTAVVVSAVGMLERFTLGYFRGKGDYAKQTFEKPHEIVSLSGIVIKLRDGYNFHLHAALADEEKNVIGGHLVDAHVKVTAEVVLLLSDAELAREYDEDTGLMLLKL